MSVKILILGVNGFIGSSLTERILEQKDWIVYGMDMESHKIEEFIGNPRFHFEHGDITKNTAWIDQHIQECDVVLPLVAIANPALYVKDPLRVFALDFDANLPLIRQCVLHKKHLVFPSTSEVYGICQDEAFDEETSNLIVGPVNKQRWIYSCSKQLLDRVIYAYGEMEDLNYTLFRPFNWVGPKLDGIKDPKEGSSRALTQFLSNILYTRELYLVDGGQQQRSFTDIDDGVDALIRIIDNKNKQASKRIFNIGNPDNNYSIAHLAEVLLSTLKTYPAYKELAESVKVISIPSADFYGKSYQDTQHRVPSIENAKKYLGWKPQVDLATSVRNTLDYHLNRGKSYLGL